MSTFFKNNAVVKCETPEKAWNFADQLFCEMEANSYKRERSKTLLAFVESSMCASITRTLSICFRILICLPMRMQKLFIERHILLSH